MLRQDTQSAESRFAWIVQLTKTITNVPFTYPVASGACTARRPNAGHSCGFFMAESRYGRSRRSASAPPRCRGIRRGISWGGRPQLVELIHPVQELEHPPRLVLIDRAEGEADVDQHVVADPDLGHVLQADALGDAAEVDLAHQQVVLAVGLRHFSRDCEAHRSFLQAAEGADHRRPKALWRQPASSASPYLDPSPPRLQAVLVDAAASGFPPCDGSRVQFVVGT